ncbi:MAG: hypothetical protein JSV58_04735 [Candidatus Bathyarchaeota archaeon]|nr:MAG: hypothetical protein JSV58_04735 [Candidatus Bathyarchaeota archaeon]
MFKGYTKWFLILFLLLSLIECAHSADLLVVEFLYYEPCPTCPNQQEDYLIFLNNSQLLDVIEDDYSTQVTVNRVYFYSEEGLGKAEQYGLGIKDYNAIIVDYEKVIPARLVNETYLIETIDAYLLGAVHDVAIFKATLAQSTIKVGEIMNITVTVKNIGLEAESFNVSIYSNESLVSTEFVSNLGPEEERPIVFTWETTNQESGHYKIKAAAEPVPKEMNLSNNIFISDLEVTSSSLAATLALLALAFSLGFFETFSPCLIILLSFLLGYALGDRPRFKESFGKVMIFGMGFILATLLLAITFGLVFLATPTLQYAATWAVCIFAVIFGLNLLGILRVPSDRMPFQSKPLVKKLARKYVFTYGGIFLLGFFFYFLDPCIAPIFVSMMPLLHPETFALTLTIFCLGAIIPFIGIGVSAGSISMLVRGTYRHRSIIRGISGLILIGYAIYLIAFYLIL